MSSKHVFSPVSGLPTNRKLSISRTGGLSIRIPPEIIDVSHGLSGAVAVVPKGEKSCWSPLARVESVMPLEVRQMPSRDSNGLGRDHLPCR
jgi:hypothetical protein